MLVHVFRHLFHLFVLNKYTYGSFSNMPWHVFAINIACVYFWGECPPETDLYNKDMKSNLDTHFLLALNLLSTVQTAVLQ